MNQIKKIQMKKIIYLNKSTTKKLITKYNLKKKL